MGNCDTAVRNNGCDPMQPLVVLIGSTLQFSDQIFRLLRLEFAGVHFARIRDPLDLLELEQRPDVVIVHEAVPNLKARIDEIQAGFAGTLVAVACNDTSAIMEANRLRPRAPVSVLQMNTQLDVWLSVLRLLLCGHVYVPADVFPARSDEPCARSAAERTRTADVEFTPREMQILPMIAEGKQNKMIAGELGLSEHTVKLHTHNIFSKLRVSNRTGAANWYLSQVEGKRNGANHTHSR